MKHALPTRRALRCALASLAPALVLLGPLPAGGQVDADRVKGAFLYNFAKFVSWPADALSEGDPLVLCVLASAETHERLAGTIQGKTAQGHPVRTRALGDASEGRSCHILYVDVEAGVSAGALAAALAGQSVLTVGESEAFARRGGIVRFFRKGNKLRFEVNPAAAEQAGLRISSRLLRLARVVGE